MNNAIITANPKRINKIRIAKFISASGSTSKAEIAAQLKLSMPTTLQNVKELTEAGIVVEEGEYESTGGRKAKVLSISKNAGYAVGVDITNNHITIVMVNTRKEIVASERQSIAFENTSIYFENLEELIKRFIVGSGVEDSKVLGVGFSLPGIVDKEQSLLIRSHTLKVEMLSFRDVGNALGYPYALENDANSAAYAELGQSSANAVYLSLSNTVGGAIYMTDHLYEGENLKSAEFGHMIIERCGRACYCGKQGCIDAYCRAGILLEHGCESLEAFFGTVRRGEENAVKVWEEYLEYLAIAVSNLRMAFDCDIVLGGYVGGFIEEFMPQLTQKVKKYNNFDSDTDYLRTGRYKFEASVYGATLGFINRFFETM